MIYHFHYPIAHGTVCCAGRKLEEAESKAGGTSRGVCVRRMAATGDNNNKKKLIPSRFPDLGHYQRNI